MSHMRKPATHWASGFNRWMVSFGVGASFASTVYMVADVAATYVLPGAAATIAAGWVAPIAAGAAFTYACYKAKKQFDQTSMKKSALLQEARIASIQGGMLEREVEELENAIEMEYFLIQQYTRLTDAYFHAEQKKYSQNDRLYLTTALYGQPRTKAVTHVPQSLFHRTLVSAGVGAGSASGLHFCLLKLLLEKLDDKGPDEFNYEKMNAALMAFLLLYTGYYANKKLSHDDQQTKMLKRTVQRGEYKYPKLQETANNLKWKLETQNGMIHALQRREAKASFSETKLDSMLQGPPSAEASQIRIPERVEQKPETSCCSNTCSCCCPAVKKCCNSSFMKSVISVATGLSFASGIYYCADVMVSLAGNTIWGKIVSGVITAGNFYSTRKYVSNQIKVNTQESAGVTETLEEHKKKCATLTKEVADLKIQLKAQQDYLNALMSESKLPLEEKDRIEIEKWIKRERAQEQKRSFAEAKDVSVRIPDDEEDSPRQSDFSPNSSGQQNEIKMDFIPLALDSPSARVLSINAPSGAEVVDERPLFSFARLSLHAPKSVRTAERKRRLLDDDQTPSPRSP
jgi:hypothetical protein